MQTVQTTHLKLSWKLAPPQTFLVSVPLIFENFGRASVVEQRYNKVRGKISEFHNSVEKYNTCIVCLFIKAALLIISKWPLSTRVVGFQYLVCNVTKSELLTKFLIIKDALKFTENVHERISSGVPFRQITGLKNTAFSLAFF